MSRGQLPPRPSGSSPESRFMQWLWDYHAHGNLLVRQAPGVRVSNRAHGQIVELENTGGGGTGRAEKYILADFEAADYLICRPWNEDYWTARRDLRQTLLDEPSNAQIADEMDITEEALDAYLAQEVLIAKAPELRADAFDGKVIDVRVESWDGATLSVVTTTYFFDYKSATFRIKYEVPFPFDPVTEDPEEEAEASEEQTIIPRYIAEETIIHAINSNKTEVTVDEAAVRKLDLNVNGRAWAQVA